MSDIQRDPMCFTAPPPAPVRAFQFPWLFRNMTIASADGVDDEHREGPC